MMNQFLIENIYRERISSIKRKNWQKLANKKNWGGGEKARKNIESGKNAKNVKMAILRGMGWGDHGIVSKFYLIIEWKIQCKISKIKIHEESVKIKEIEILKNESKSS